MFDYDVVYLGSGHACWHGAMILRSESKKVALVDTDLTGGTSINYAKESPCLK